MDRTQYTQYEEKRRALHRHFRRCRIHLWLVTLILLAVVSTAAWLLFVHFAVIPGGYPLYVAIQLLLVMLSLILTFGGDKAYIATERSQLLLLEQEEPFSRFDV